MKNVVIYNNQTLTEKDLEECVKKLHKEYPDICMSLKKWKVLRKKELEK